MNELYGISALIGTFCGLVTIYLLFFISKGPRRYSNRLLAIVLLVSGGYFLIRLLLLSGPVRGSVSIDQIAEALYLLITPCSLIYIRSVISGQRSWLPGNGWYLLPIVCGLVINCIPQGLVPIPLRESMRDILAGSCLLFQWVLLLHNINQSGSKEVPHWGLSKRWLIGYSVLISLIGLGPLLPVFSGPEKEPWVSAIAYALLSGGLLLKPGILFGAAESLGVSSDGSALPDARASAGENTAPQPDRGTAIPQPDRDVAALSQEEENAAPVAEDAGTVSSPEVVETTLLAEEAMAALPAEDPTAAPLPEDETTEDHSDISKPLFDEARLREQMTRVSAFISAHQTFKKKGLTLAGLAVELSIPQHRLSYIIKNGFQQQFNDFINRYRVDYIKEKMSSRDDWKNMTLDAVGLDAGFSSRSTFFGVFKKLTGQTPSEFARQLKE